MFRNLTRRNKIIVGASAFIVLCCGLLSLSLLFPASTETETRSEIADISTPLPPTAEESSTNTAVPTATSPNTPTKPPPTNTAVPSPTNTTRPTSTPRPQLRITASTAALRSGPGNSFDSVASLNSGDTAVVLARNGDGSWYLVRLPDATEGWISNSVVEQMGETAVNQVAVAATIPALPTPINTPGPTSPPATAALPTSTLTPVAATEPPAPTQEPTATQPPAQSPAQVVITWVNKQDEFVDIQNVGGSDQDINGWVLVSEKGDQRCTLGGILPAGASLRIWAMAEDAGMGGYNCGFGSNIWNNSEPDPAALYDNAGNLVARS